MRRLVRFVMCMAFLGTSLQAQQSPEPQVEPPTAQELSPEVPPTVKPVPGEGSVGDGEPGDAAAPEETGHGQAAEAAEPAEAETDTIALYYLRRCSGCHTIGRGYLSGPDLLPSTKWPREDLRAAVERMEKNVGPMTDEQIEGLVDLLKSDDLQERLDEAASQRVAEMAAKLDPGSPVKGKALFFGNNSFDNGGVACFACHAVSERGGNMAVDLTLAYERLGESALLSATEEPSFPMMRASYGSRPVTSQEAVHIVAYLEEVASEADAAGLDEADVAQPEDVGMLHGIAGGAAILFVGGIVFVAQRRRAGARSRLVRESHRR
ncbi:MAG: cytochrome c [Thermoanaerobaculia bacterium]|nr:cytochrome c [Thermoanaerobaculia bacterium]